MNPFKIPVPWTAKSFPFGTTTSVHSPLRSHLTRPLHVDTRRRSSIIVQWLHSPATAFDDVFIRLSTVVMDLLPTHPVHTEGLFFFFYFHQTLLHQILGHSRLLLRLLLLEENLVISRGPRRENLHKIHFCTSPQSSLN